MKNKIRKLIKERISTILEMDNYNYPMGADTSDAPWNNEDPKPETKPDNHFVDLIHFNNKDEYAIFKNEKGELFSFYVGNIPKQDYAEFGAIGNEDIDTWEIDDEAMEGYVNQNWNDLSKGQGFDDYESGDYDIILINDKKIIDNLKQMLQTNVF